MIDAFEGRVLIISHPVGKDASIFIKPANDCRSSYVLDTVWNRLVSFRHDYFMSEELQVLVFVKHACHIVLPTWFEVLREDIDLVLIIVCLAFIELIEHFSIDEVDVAVEHVSDDDFLDVAS